MNYTRRFAELIPALFLAVMRAHPEMAWRAHNRYDGQSPPSGRFIAGLELPTGQVVCYPPVEMWTLLDNSGIRTANRAPFQLERGAVSDAAERLIDCLTAQSRTETK